MTRIGVTGHIDLSPASIPLIVKAIRAALAPHVAGGLTGISCIAAGADTIFAEAVLDLGGTLEVVVPAADYRSTLDPEDVRAFDRLVKAAHHVRVMPHERSGHDAYEDANEAVLSSCELMFAVWDATSSHERAGTTAVVEAARARGLPVKVIWPAGAERRRKTAAPGGG